jgi:hypothetical protein
MVVTSRSDLTDRIAAREQPLIDRIAEIMGWNDLQSKHLIDAIRAVISHDNAG